MVVLHDSEYVELAMLPPPVNRPGHTLFGQVAVGETLELGGIQDFTTGGTIHVIVNNQIGKAFNNK